MDSETASSIQRLREALKKAEPVTIESLTRKDELGIQLSFAGCEDVFRMYLELFGDLLAIDDLRYATLPPKIIDRFASQVNGAIGVFGNVQGYNPNVNNPVGQRDVIAAQVRNQVDSLCATVLPYLPYLTQDSVKLASLTEEAQKELDVLRNLAAEVTKEKDSALVAIRSAAGQVGVEAHSKYFEIQANEYSNAGMYWLATTWLMAIAGVIVFYHAFFGAHKIDASAMTVPAVVYAAITRFIITSLMYTGVFLANRNYTANRHNYVVNKHRQNALATFQAFVKAAGDDKQIKNAVLLHASQSIFTPQITGYHTNEPPPQMAGNIVEIVKEALPGTK